MSSLEELLLESGAMTKAQVAIVRDDQRIHGGSLDLSILALGFLTENALQQLLAQLWNQEGKVDFEQAPTTGAVELLTAEQAADIGAVPQSLLGEQLYVLVHNTGAVDRLGELEELAQYDIIPVGVNEVRLKYLLDRCYKIPRTTRMTQIMDRLMSQADAAKARRHAHTDPLIGDPMAGLDEPWLAGAIIVESPVEDLAATIPDGLSPAKTLDEDDIPILEDELLIEIVEDDEEPDEGDAEPERTLEEAQEPLSPEQFQNTLDAVQTMDALPEVFFRFGVGTFKSVALFKVQGGMVKGWRGAGLGMVPETIRAIEVPVQSDTFLAKGIQESVYSAQGGSNAVEDQITEQLGCAKDAFLVSATVKVGERPVLVVCAISEQQTPDTAVLDQLSHLCHLSSQTVVRLIMERKKTKQSAPPGTTPAPAPAPEPPKAPEPAPAPAPEPAPEPEPEPEPEPKTTDKEPAPEETSDEDAAEKKPAKAKPRRPTTRTKKKATKKKATKKKATKKKATKKKKS